MQPGSDMKTPLALITVLATFAAGAQPSATVPKNIRATNTIDYLSDGNGLATFENLYGIPLEPGRVMGNSYLNADWKRTTFLLYDVDKMLQGYHSRYEIQGDQFEIKATDGIKILNGKKVKSFVWLDSLTKSPHYFVNGRDYTDEENIKCTGFFEVLTEGSLTLLAQTEVVVKAPTYNDKLDMGRRDTQIVKRTHYYYLDNSTLKELPSSKKKLLPLFGEHATVVDEFIRANKLSINDENHLKTLFEHYNTRIVTN